MFSLKYALILTVVMAPVCSFGAGPYLQRITHPIPGSPNYLHVEEYFDSGPDAKAACLSEIATLGYPGRSCGLGEDGKGDGLSIWEDGWLQVGTEYYLVDMMFCSVGYRYLDATATCVPWKNRYHDKPRQCPVAYGHPIYPMVGAKRVEEGLGRVFGESWRVGYDSRPKLPINDSGAVYEPALLPLFGELWTSSWHRALVVQAASGQTAVQASRGLGAWASFTGKSDGTYAPDPDVSDRLATVSGGWRYLDAQAKSEETYDPSGVLETIGHASGSTLTYSYSTSSTAASVAPVAGLLIQVQDQFARSVRFTYEQPSDPSLAPRITTMTDSSGRVTGFSYDAVGNLKQITWPDTSVRQFLYERPTDLPWALTGILDENNARTVTYGYDSAGRAIDTQAAGGVDHYSAAYTTPPSWLVTETYDSAADVIWRDHSWVVPQGTTVTLPNGQTTSLGATGVQGMPRLTSQSQPAGLGCSASTSSMAYDGNGNVVQSDDFDAHRSCMAYDASNREVARVEGLAASASTPACGTYTVANAALAVGSRKTTTTWHPLWRLATQVAEPGRITTSVYNGQADPFNGGATASCVTPAANLPDGSPIAVLCKRVEQATTDVDGHLGFTATLQPGVVNRVSSWTYNQYGQVLTSVDALGNTTTSTYWGDTSFTGADPNAVGHTVGDLKTVQNAALKTTTYDKYDKNGNLLQSTDANSVVTLNTYDARQRLTSTSVGGQLTGYAYWPTGLLKRVTQPDASYVAYGYDDAHRLTTVGDNLGNTITYTLDNMGNRTGEATKDPGGVLRRQLTRSMDALSRVQQTTGV